MSSSVVRIATRASRLALWQANYISSRLREAHPELSVELVKVVSTGDTVKDRPLYEIGGVGVFTKEVQEAILSGQADLAVHSLKDLPTIPHPHLSLACVPERAAVADAFLSPSVASLSALPEGATVATSSLRRRAQLLRYRPDLNLIDIRGNVETRIQKMKEQNLGGMILAEAGLNRLGLESEITEVIDTEVMLPAVSQGALGLECRSDDSVTSGLLLALECEKTRQAVEAERALLRELQGGCHVPIAGHATVSDKTLILKGRVLNEHGSECHESEIQGPASDARRLGEQLAKELIEMGARKLLGFE